MCAYCLAMSTPPVCPLYQRAETKSCNCVLLCLSVYSFVCWDQTHAFSQNQTSQSSKTFFICLLSKFENSIQLTWISLHLPEAKQDR